MQLALTSSSSDNSSASHVGRGPADSFLSSWSNHRCSSRSIASTSPTSLLLFFDPGTQLTRNEKITLCNTKKVQKSSWTEPYSSSSSFTKQSCSKMALYRWIRTESRWNNYYYTFTDYSDTVTKMLQGHLTQSIAKIKSVRPGQLSSESEKWRHSKTS